MHSKQAMMTMRTVIALPDNDIKVFLNLEWREIVVNFPITLPSKSHQSRLDIESFKFRIPLGKLKEIYVEKSSVAYRALIIPLGFPPEFFRQTKDIEATHVAEETIWHEWRTWYRQTEIVENQARLETMPVKNRNERTVIDVGKHCLRSDCMKLLLNRYRRTLDYLPS
jgi:hypothetical protein